MRTDACVSADRKYRYWLLREWDKSLPVVAFIGLNPSIADETTDDPTIRKCVKYAKAWGFGSLLMLNLYAYRATDPDELWKARDRGRDIVGIYKNGAIHLLEYLFTFGVTRCIAAWGKGKQQKRGEELRWKISNLECLKQNNDGSPSHPLYQRDNVAPVKY